MKKHDDLDWINSEEFKQLNKHHRMMLIPILIVWIPLLIITDLFNATSLFVNIIIALLAYFIAKHYLFNIFLIRGLSIKEIASTIFQDIKKKINDKEGKLPPMESYYNFVSSAIILASVFCLSFIVISSIFFKTQTHHIMMLVIYCVLMKFFHNRFLRDD